MSTSRTLHFGYRVLLPGELSRALRACAKALSADAERAEMILLETLPGKTTRQRKVSFTELDSYSGEVDASVIVRSWIVDGPSYGLRLVVDPGSYYAVSIDADSVEDVDSVTHAFTEVLSLPEWKPPKGRSLIETVEGLVGSSLKPILERLTALESAAERKDGRLRCFLSYRFTERNELLALRIETFLSCLNVEVITGSSYEPRQVTEKVMSRVRQQHDFVVLLVTAEGESMWTRDEIGAFLHRGLALVPLVEEGASFAPGLFGDVEYIPFAPGHIGDAFLKVAQALSFIRMQRSSDIGA